MPTQRPIDAGKDTRERRQMRRVETAREVLFAADDSISGPLRRGTAIDMSAGGLKIVSHFPEGAGTHLHIELQPATTDREAEVIFYRGRVMHVSRSDGGVPAMGIRFVQRANGSRTGTVGTSSSSRTPKPLNEARSGFSELRRDALDAAEDQIGEAGRRKRRFLPIFLFFLRASRIPRFALAVILLAGLIGVWAFQPEVGADPSASTGSDSPQVPESHVRVIGGSKAYLEPAAKAETPNAQSELATVPAGFVRPGLRPQLDPALSGAEPNGAEPRGSTARFAGEMGRVETLAASGDHMMALAVLDGALAETDGVAGAWVRAAREYRDASMEGHAAELLPGTDAFDMEPARAGLDPVPGLRLEVDTDSRVLRVMDGDQMVRDFPVGIGKGGSTPRGNFTIANMLTDPDWHNRGRIVPAGSPANPLGTRWMGLGRDGRATRYGIHGTNEPASIGGAEGRGCIRMRTGDAEELFQWCGLGTPVAIR